MGQEIPTNSLTMYKSDGERGELLKINERKEAITSGTCSPIPIHISDDRIYDVTYKMRGDKTP